MRCSCRGAFISGITGRFFRQFAVTIAVSTVLSALNSLTLSPALAALLLKPDLSTLPARPGGVELTVRGQRDLLTWLLETLLGWFFRLFNRMFSAGRRLRLGCRQTVASQSAGAAGIRGPAGPDVCGVCTADRWLRPATRPGSGYRRHPVARFGGAVADSGARGPGRTDCARPPAWRIRSPSRACRSCSRLTAPISARCSSSSTRSRVGRLATERQRDHGPTAGGVAAADQGWNGTV